MQIQLFCPWRLKKLCFYTASLAITTRLAVQIQSLLKYLGTKWPPRDKGLFGENVHAKSGKEVWDMINTLFVTTVAVEPTFVALCPCAILSNFFEEQCTQSHPQLFS